MTPSVVPDQFRWSHALNHHLDERLLRLRPGHRVVDLGCGLGLQLAYLGHHHRVHGTGVDSNPDMIGEARSAFQGGPVDYVEADAVDWLEAQAFPVDAVYSRFGAVWFTDPDRLLPAIAARLRPGGRFAFSHIAPGYRSFDVQRWDYPIETWFALLRKAGFSEVFGGTLPCKGSCAYDGCTGVMVVEGTR